ncbi:translocation protein SEC62-like [Saccostrea echinata]|uniref:translocation protein SEC62-like n=1 Tax=Saccostrea echinata TaxID=191078 RepID=UPI002A7EE857|nr:translocation protein SEC62-like [Saccostrea echinata]
MADRKKKQKKIDSENEKPSKEEYAIAKHLRFTCPVKEAKFVPMQNMVKCFYGNQAIDTLMDSKWAKSSKSEIQFTDRKSCLYFLERLMVKGLFHRATKIERGKKDKDKLKKKKKDEEIEDEKEKKSKKEKKKIKDKDAKDSDADKPDTVDEKKVEEKEKKKDEPKKDEEKKKKEKKLRLDMAEEQRFIDGEEIYVWIYDPVPMSTFLIGLLMVLGAALLCVFPLWPDWLRVAVYYVSLVGASFVGFILFLAVIRGILFCVLWVLTLGKVHLWILPNLTEDVGFFDSFKPLYTYKVINKEEQEKEKKKKEEKRKKRKKREQEAGDSESETNDKNEEEQGQEEEEEGQNGDQEFEMVQREELEDEEEEEAEGSEEGEVTGTEEEDKKTK